LQFLVSENGRIGPGSGILDVEDEFIEEALALASQQNITCEPSGIAGLALLLQTQNDVPKDSKILIVNTGKTKYSSVRR
jgi:threonine dehydratase